MLFLFIIYSYSCITISNQKTFELNEKIDCLNAYNVRNIILLENVSDFTLNLYDTEQVVLKSLNNIIINLNISNSIIVNSYNITFISKNGFNYQEKISSTDVIDSEQNYCHFYYNKSCLVCDKFLYNGKCIYPSPLNCYKYKNKCIECFEGYYLDNLECKKCIDNCRKCNKDKCLLCKNGYYGNNCTLNNDYIQDKLFNCNNSFSNGYKCIIKDNCLYSDLNNCYLCNNSLLINGSCIEIEGIEKSSNKSLICKDNYFNSNNSCISCLIYGDCNYCNLNGCINCKSGLLNLNGICINETCNKNQYFNGYKCINKTIEILEINNCINQKNNICLGCNDNYYLLNNSCNSCPLNCILCNSTKCLKCNNQTYLENGKCNQLTKEIKDKCLKTIPGKSNQCAICKDNYYKLNNNCYNCPLNCNKCNSFECLNCINNTFLNENYTCSSYDLLKNCLIKTNKGCNKCENNYYLLDRYCYECTPKCNNCNEYYCYNCSKDYILVNNQCIHYSKIKHCKKALNGKCIKCSFFYKDDNCNFYLPWYIILLIVIISLFIIIILSSIIIIIVNLLFTKDKSIEEITLFN